MEDAQDIIQFFRREAYNLRTLRKLVITPGGTSVLDINGDAIEFPGLTYGNPALESLLRELGVIFTVQTLHEPSPKKEFRLSARWTWGHDRVM